MARITKEVLIWSPEYTGDDILEFMAEAGFEEGNDFSIGKKADKIFLMPKTQMLFGQDARRFNFQLIAYSDLY